MATGPGFPGATNVFIPSTNREADGRLIVGFSRNKEKFSLPRYCQYTKVDAPAFYWMRIANQEQARVVNTQDFMWPDGMNRPQQNRDTEAFAFVPARTERYDYGFTIGQKTVKYASWPIKEQHAQIKAQQAMTARTIRALAVLTTAANWNASGTYDPTGDLSANHTSATATALGVGGSVYSGTSTDPRLKKALDTIAVSVTLDTSAAVGDEPDVFKFLINPTTARKLSESAEVHDYLKSSPDALNELKTGQSPNAKYGLPRYVYGYECVVDPTVRVTTRVGATLARSFCVADNALVFLSRVGGLEGVYGAPSFSTLTSFQLEEFTIETFDDPKNRLTEGHVVEDTVEVLTCPASGWYVADLSS